MLDDLRNSASNSFQDDEEEDQSPKPREVIRIRPVRCPARSVPGNDP